MLLGPDVKNNCVLPELCTTTQTDARSSFWRGAWIAVADPAYVMAQMGHTDPAFTLRVYAHAMRRDDEARARLKALLEGADWAPLGKDERQRATNRRRPARPRNDKRPAGAGRSPDGHGWFRTSDLSRVKRALSR